MAGYGQFCSVARAHEVLGGRWTLLIVRELLCGSTRFNHIRRGIPRISRTMLSERLQALAAVGAVVRTDGEHGPEYALTPSGQELGILVSSLASWGQRWLARRPVDEDIDLDPLLVDMQRRVRVEAVPKEPFVLRFEMQGHPRRFILMKSDDLATPCTKNPGFPEPILVHGPLSALVGWWRGDVGFVEAKHSGLTLEGPRALVRAFPDWFDRYQFAHIAPARVRAAASPRGASAGGMTDRR